MSFGAAFPSNHEAKSGLRADHADRLLPIRAHSRQARGVVHFSSCSKLIEGVFVFAVHFRRASGSVGCCQGSDSKGRGVGERGGEAFRGRTVPQPRRGAVEHNQSSQKGEEFARRYTAFEHSVMFLGCRCGCCSTNLMHLESLPGGEASGAAGVDGEGI